MREIKTHHDGHGLNESIHIETDEPAEGGAAHRYIGMIEDTDGVGVLTVLDVQFQKGPRDVEGSTPGVTEAVLLAIVEDRLSGSQDGPFACSENAMALRAVKTALEYVRLRADNRAKRGVLGTRTA